MNYKDRKFVLNDIENVRTYRMLEGFDGDYLRLDNLCERDSDIEIDYRELASKYGAGVFCIFYSSGKPELKHGYDVKIGMSMRWDNSLGFIGGKVDKGESLKGALVREIKEEINYDMKSNDPNIEPVSVFIDVVSGFMIHTYSYMVSYNELMYIKNNYLQASMAADEINGFCTMNIMLDYNDEIVENFRNNSFSATAGQELDIFLEEVLPNKTFDKLESKSTFVEDAKRSAPTDKNVIIDISMKSLFEGLTRGYTKFTPTGYVTRTDAKYIMNKVREDLSKVLVSELNPHFMTAVHCPRISFYFYDVEDSLVDVFSSFEPAMSYLKTLINLRTEFDAALSYLVEPKNRGANNLVFTDYQRLESPATLTVGDLVSIASSYGVAIGII